MGCMGNTQRNLWATGFYKAELPSAIGAAGLHILLYVAPIDIHGRLAHGDEGQTTCATLWFANNRAIRPKPSGRPYGQHFKHPAY